MSTSVEVRRCPVCRSPWQGYSILMDKCYCAKGHLWIPGQSQQQQPAQA